jgi:hypothetical protein
MKKSELRQIIKEEISKLRELMVDGNYEPDDYFDNPAFYKKDGTMKPKYYKEEFGYSFEEKQNWEKVLDQVKKKYNFDEFDPKSLKNFEKIKDEAKQIYIKKYGSPKYKEYPF